MNNNHLALFRIKNDEFNYKKYGLVDQFFSIDITKNIGADKGVGTTQYAVLDGTTRIDTVSRQPGNINFQGNIADVHHAPFNGKYIKNFGSKGRAQVQLELLEDLRDNAIIVDIITQYKTFKNYIITNISSGISLMGIMDVNLTMKEFLTFGDEIDNSDNSRESVSEQLLQNQVLKNFTLPAFNNDAELINVLSAITYNSTLSIPYIISFGSSDTNPDILMSSAIYERGTLNTNQVGNKVHYTFTYPIIRKRFPMYSKTSGYVEDNYKIKIEIEPMENNSPLTEQKTETIIDNYPSYGIPFFNEIGKYRLTITLLQNLDNVDRVIYSTINRDALITPLFSNVTNGINPLVENPQMNDDFITTYGSVKGSLSGLNFLRKCSQNTYRTSPNLLPHSNMGYLYQSSYESIDIDGNRNLNFGFVFIHPDALNAIKREVMKQVNKPNHFMYGKTIIWW